MKKYRTKLLNGLMIALLVIIANGCYYDQVVPGGPPPDAEISFSNQIQPIFDTKCAGCHPPAAGLDLTPGNAYGSINKTPLIEPSNPSSSVIYTKPAPNGGHPGTYSQTESATVLQWIEQGAINN